jgi:hypothetical protein
VGDATGAEGVLERLGDLFLTNHIGEELGAPFAIKNL